MTDEPELELDRRAVEWPPPRPDPDEEPVEPWARALPFRPLGEALREPWTDESPREYPWRR
jgi:hypothetical protein